MISIHTRPHTGCRPSCVSTALSAFGRSGRSVGRSVSRWAVGWWPGWWALAAISVLGPAIRDRSRPASTYAQPRSGKKVLRIFEAQKFQLPFPSPCDYLLCQSNVMEPLVKRPFVVKTGTNAIEQGVSTTKKGRRHSTRENFGGFLSPPSRSILPGCELVTFISCNTMTQQPRLTRSCGQNRIQQGLGEASTCAETHQLTSKQARFSSFVASRFIYLRQALGWSLRAAPQSRRAEHPKTYDT